MPPAGVRLLQRIDRLVRQPVDPLVARHPGMTGDPVPLHPMPRGERLEALPEVLVLTGLRSAVRQPLAFQFASHSVIPLRTYCESV